jgi:hypothetical protein
VIVVRRTGWRRGPHEIDHGGVVVARWDWSPTARQGELAVAGRVVTATASGWTGRRWRFAEADGRPVAAAEDVGRARWDLGAADGVHRFENVRRWASQHQEHRIAGRAAGWVARTGWAPRVEADLPALDPLLRLCAVVALAAVWEAEASS